MILAVPREIFPGERRVSIVPATVPALAKAGFEIRVETGAGEAAGYPDSQYKEKGAHIVADRSELIRSAQAISYVRCGGANPGEWQRDLADYHEGQVILGFLDPPTFPAEAHKLAQVNVTSFAMELIPRITRAQSMDALSSMATVSGYKAVLIAANLLPRMFPLLMTAAGTITPARVLVIGAGVAGLQAIATSRQLGAVVQAYDVRPAAKEQIQSMGAKAVELQLATESVEQKGGYASAQSESVYQQQRQMLGRVVAESDVVITTAAIPGKKAPVLVNSDAVEAMSPGSVVVDLAAERGGNCELTRPGETFIYNGVSIAAPLNVPSLVPYHASQMYSKNISALLLHLTKSGEFKIDTTDEITRETLLTHEGQIASEAVRKLAG
jgi:NAD(P) transhydrogenase subunit alpha